MALATFPEPYITSQTSDEKWARGTDVEYLKTLHAFWYNGSTAGAPKYDWRAREAVMNARMPQFKTQIGEFDVHFVHQRSRDPNAVPLLFSHGWPGSFLECTRILRRLTNPSPGKQAFHVVCPSIPGYGFSSAPTRPGFGARQAAEVFIQLMARLNYTKYVMQGGDWGCVIGSWVATLDSDHCLGLHINMAPILPPLNLFQTRNPFYAAWRSFTTVLDLVFPSLRFDAYDAHLTQAPLQWGYDLTGYFHEQSTKPDTIGIAFHDSPIGLASWLVEKYRIWSDCHGDVETRFDKQHLLDHIMVYYTSGTITSSMRFYYETTHQQGESSMLRQMMSWDVRVPTGFAAFPAELGQAPEKWLAEYYNLKSFRRMDKGGHFAALEEPDLLVDDIQQFVTNHVLETPAGTKEADAPDEVKDL